MDDLSHGSMSTYNNHRCRCKECKAANTATSKLHRVRRYKSDPPPEAHGRYTTYCNWGCRCVLCSEAMAIYNRNRRKSSGN